MPLLPGEFPALLIGVTAAIFGCVPETDHLDELIIALAAVVAIELLAGRPSGRWLAAAETTIVLAAGLYGATGRDSATVGAWFAFWPLALVALGFLASSIMRDRFRVGPARRILIEIIGLAAAIWVARTGALQATVEPAIRSVAIAAPVSIALAAVVGSARRATAT